jgi:hypothetical protein
MKGELMNNRIKTIAPHWWIKMINKKKLPPQPTGDPSMSAFNDELKNEPFKAIFDGLKGLDAEIDTAIFGKPLRD